MSILIPEEETYLPRLNKKQQPVAQKAWQYLQFQDLIRPGSVITREHLEKAFNRPYKKEDWSFLGPFLLLKTKLESEGFFITQKGCEIPTFRILKSEEMAEFAQRKLMKNLASNYQIAYTMAAHNTESLDENQKKVHKKAQNQAAQTALIQQKLLLDDRYF